VRRCARAAQLAVLAALLLGAALFAAAARADAAESGADSPASLERLQREVEERRARVEAFARQEQGLLDTLEGIDQAAGRIARDVEAARREVTDAEASLAVMQARARRAEQASAATRHALALRLDWLYREGRSGTLRLLAGAQSLRDLVRRARLLRRAIEQDAALLARARAEREALAQARADAKASARASAEAMRRLAARASSLDEERASKQEVLAGLRSDGTRERGALAEIEAAAKTLEETLLRLGKVAPQHAASTPAVRFIDLRGRLRAPVAAPVARRFGRVVDAEFRTATFRKGIDFAAPAGASVHAVAPGEVRFAGWFRGYGKMVIVDHGEGYFTICAHLDEIQVAVGDEVQAEQPLGTVGDTGSLAGPLLYFEIRHDSEPLDPSRWLAGGTGLE